MKLTEIQIDCPGVWRNLTLPVPPTGLSAFYGPNEAGKTTLRQFIAGVLFGFPPTGDQTGHIATGSALWLRMRRDHIDCTVRQQGLLPA